MQKLAHYWKGILAGLTAVLIAVQAAVSDDVLTDSEKVTIALAVVGAISVVLKSNAPKEPA